MTIESQPPQSYEPGVVLAGKYRIERRLGAGGMGVVLEAMHLMLSERVAIKLLLPHAIDVPELRERFYREAQAAARINSPHVAKVRDVGELPSGEPFIVMEILDGIGLNELLEQQRVLESQEAAKLLLQACEGLAAAHGRGVIHRDIKASNLFIAAAPDGSPLLKILDFGISKLSRSETTREASLTSTQSTMGSPLSMSPEQMRSARDVDFRTDIWSLGTVLYRCVTGAHPFEADTLPQLCSKVLECEWIPVEQRAPELSPELAHIIGRCLRKDPNERYRDVAELANALAPLAGEGGPAAAERCRKILTQETSQRSVSQRIAHRDNAQAGSNVREATEPSSRKDANFGAAGSSQKPTSEVASNTGTAFGRTQRRSLPPVSRLGVAAILALAGLSVVAASLFWLRHGPPTLPPATSAAAGLVSAVPVQTVESASAPTVVILPVASASASIGAAAAAASAHPATVRNVTKEPGHLTRRSPVMSQRVEPFELRK